MSAATASLRLRYRVSAARLTGLRAYNPRQRRSRLRGPLRVHIQTIDRCNAACVMCPYSALVKRGPGHLMSMALYARILGELQGPGTARSICLMLQNEPLLDRHLAHRARLAKSILGRALRVSVVTNGASLTSARIDELLDAGVDRISVSIDAYREETFRSIRRGLDFARIVHNTKVLIRRADRGRVTVRLLRQRANEGEERAFARFWKAQGAAVRFYPLTNRAGTLDGFERMKSRRMGPLRRCANAALNRLLPVCLLPFSTLYVLWDGRVILCCHDWEPRDIVGDLSKQSLAEVWNGEAMNHYRHVLWSLRADESLVCRDCSLAKGFWNI